MRSENAIFEDGAKCTELRSARELVEFADTLFVAFDSAFSRAPLRLMRTVGEDTFDIRTSLEEHYSSAVRGLSGRQSQFHPSCRILIACGNSLGLPSTPLWSKPFYNALILESQLATSQYRVYHYPEYDFWQFFCLKTRRALQLMWTPQSVPDWDRGSPLRNFFQWHLSSKSAGLIHAGALGVDGSGALFFGPGKSGKSGTVLAGILHGMQSVGDDYVFVDASNGVTAMSLFSTLKSDSQGLDRLGVDQTAGWAQRTNWQGKKEFTFADITTAAQPDRIKIDALCLPQVAFAQRTSISKLGSKEAFLALAPTGVAHIPGGRMQNFSFCAELSRRLPAFRITLGTDPVEISDTLQSFISKINQ